MAAEDEPNEERKVPLMSDGRNDAIQTNDNAPVRSLLVVENDLPFKVPVLAVGPPTLVRILSNSLTAKRAENGAAECAKVVRKLERARYDPASVVWMLKVSLMISTRGTGEGLGAHRGCWC